MTTLQKFKLLATQCAVAGSPTRSPTTSPVIHLRRRKTLRMLLNNGSSGRSDLPPSIGDDTSPDRISSDGDSPEKVKELVRSHKLKDLLFSEKEFSPENDGADGGSEVRGIDRVRSMRPLSATFRRRLLKRIWRPMLVSIPE